MQAHLSAGDASPSARSLSTASSSKWPTCRFRFFQPPRRARARARGETIIGIRNEVEFRHRGHSSDLLLNDETAGGFFSQRWHRFADLIIDGHGKPGRFAAKASRPGCASSTTSDLGCAEPGRAERSPQCASGAAPISMPARRDRSASLTATAGLPGFAVISGVVSISAQAHCGSPMILRS